MRRAVNCAGLCLVVALLFGWSVPRALAEGGALDGKTFLGEMTEKGKTKGDKDTFVFKDGKFRSTACDAYGFAETAYSAVGKEGETTFEATAESPKEGTMKWKGTIKGDTIEGTTVWTKKGQADMSYTFKGALKK
jgi:hypothetical protein